MERKWWMKAIFLFVCTAMTALYLYPTVANIDVEKSQAWFKRKINLGLDLQGGLYIVMGVDFDKVYKETAERSAEGLKARLTELGVKNIKTNVYLPKSVDFIDLATGNDNSKDPNAKLRTDDPRITLNFDQSQRDKVHSTLKGEYTNLRLTGEKPGEFELGIANNFRTQIRDNTIDQSIEVIRNRIDEFGVAEPSITSQGLDRIVIELPGVKDVERAKALIGRTAKLEFKIVDDKGMAPGDLISLIAQLEEENNLKYDEDGKQKFSEYAEQINKFAIGKIPKEDIIAFERQVGQDGKTVIGRIPYLLFAKSEVTGEQLQDASVQQDPQTSMPVVSFEMNPRGAVLFGKLTRANIKNRLAIVLDETVYSAPVIQSEISNRGQISMGQGNYNQVLEEARDLAIVLRAGALPAKLEFLEQRAVGPSLGADSIRSGGLAALIGSLAVFLFILIYYRGSGLIAVVSLILNVAFVMAILVGIEATLTLPGIAGIALTVGIAVDSNVIIYERIREEIREGKQPQGSVSAGFQKALRTILDANITNAAGALVLLNFGTGPIKGFAVTMLIGIMTTLFTAIFVCKLMFDFYLRAIENRPQARLSI